jgi:CRISPR/Cas system CSM-associated protein Csm2 small subunit
MSTNGAHNSHKSSGSPSGTPPSLVQTQQALNDARISLDSDRSDNTSSPIYSNGVNGRSSFDSDSDTVDQLRKELDRTREEKETLAGQYRNLLAKLTTMRTTLGNKLQQDAVRTFPPSMYLVAKILSLSG